MRSDPYDFARVQNAVGIERLLDGAHDADRFAMLGDKKIHLAIADPVLTGTGALHRERTRDHAVIETARLSHFFRSIGVDHKDEMKIPVTHMTYQCVWER